MMINAVSNSSVPHLTVNIGASYGAGNYGMCGRAYDPRFLFAWPNARSAVMGPAQLAGVLSIVGRQSAAARGVPFDEEADASHAGDGRGPDRGRVAPPVPHAPGSTTTASSTPGTPGTVLGICLSVIDNQPIHGHTRLRRVPDVKAETPVATDAPVGSIRHLLVANRGEIARRIMRTARAMGIRRWPSAPTPTRSSPYVAEADLAVRLPGVVPGRHLPPRRCSWSMRQRAAAADAVHPGYGFLSESADFARAVSGGRARLGRSPGRGHRGHGLEDRPKDAHARPPGCPRCRRSPSTATCCPDAEELRDLGWPVLVKASAGGGGRGMRVVPGPR